ncbi:MAG: hypothetical protein JWO48_781, partial [Bryobacterales bacterium]|nr:hypothetical protein [Bryobacterales bacterium]
AGIDIIRVAGTISVCFFPIEARHNLAPLVLQTIGPVIRDEPIPFAGLYARGGILPSTIFSSVAVA